MFNTCQNYQCRERSTDLPTSIIHNPFRRESLPRRSPNRDFEIQFISLIRVSRGGFTIDTRARA